MIIQFTGRTSNKIFKTLRHYIGITTKKRRLQQSKPHNSNCGLPIVQCPAILNCCALFSMLATRKVAFGNKVVEGKSRKTQEPAIWLTRFTPNTTGTCPENASLSRSHAETIHVAPLRNTRIVTSIFRIAQLWRMRALCSSACTQINRSCKCKGTT